MPPAPAANILLVLRDRDKASEIQDHFLLQGFPVEWVNNDEKAINGLASNQFNVLLTELLSTEIDGLRIMSVALNRDPTTPVILLANADQTELAMRALDEGGFACHPSPCNPHAVQRSIHQGLHRQSLEYEILRLKRQLDTQHGLPNLIGDSRAIAALHDRVRQSASDTAPVIIIGEAGTGKKHLAQTIHNQSPRSHRPFLKLAFAQNEQATLERTLFGHGPGVFPDSPEGQAGQIEYADEGTLFLQNLCQLSPVHSDQLINTLEERQTQRLGETRTIPIDLRLIVSITPPLKDSDPTNKFLQTLQQRFGALTLEIPPLRDRSEDIPPLTQYFIDTHNQTLEKNVTGIDADVLQLLTQCPWPGNIREIENTIRQMIIGAQDRKTLSRHDIPVAILKHPDMTSDDIPIPHGTSMHDAERIIIENTLIACNHDKNKCAKILGIGLRTLYRKLNEYNTPD
ncbi:MAG TPA: sigma-54-dependent Fis family transcriptional regulator [Candidatus Hydrogenedentes bacterium]|nr:sigma-54-dependent Fis family transcriptional regulator [Candidatus Hydrogenedentota bacterium]